MINYAPLQLDVLLEPIDPLQPAGVFDEEDETYQGIDQEMVKLGGLNEPRMDWPYIDEASRQYLSRQCKHFRVAGHLMTARLRARTWPAWVDALNVLAGMVERYWEAGYPKPGLTGLLAKRKLVALLLDRLGDAVPSLDDQSFKPELQTTAQKVLGRLRVEAAKAQLDATQLARLEAKLRQQAEASRLPDATPAKPTPSPGQGGTAISEEFFNTPGNLNLSEERESRRSLLTVADFVNQQDAYDPTGYQLRRFALWAHLHIAPPARREQRTELMGVPADIVQGYQDALRNNAVTPVLLQRIEKSVASSPYWIRGSFLAAGIAARLEMKEVAKAIQHATERFVRRIPMLTELCFNDGRPFVDNDTMQWLSGAADESSGTSAVQEYGNLREELVAQLDNEGVEVVLRRLQDLQSNTTAPRQRCYATVIAADLLASRGLSWLADDLYVNVARTMQDTPAEQWEPALYEHLTRHQTVQIVIEQERRR